MSKLKHKIKQFLFWILRPFLIRTGRTDFAKVSANGFDDKLARYLNFNNGFFIELGANDGISQSNTYYLEKIRGWRGILIEPLSYLYEQAKINRKKSQIFNYACVPSDYDGTEVEITNLSLMSFVDGALHHTSEIDNQLTVGKAYLGIETVDRVKVPARTLTEILDKCDITHIDFMSLDVEGYEASVLKGLDLEKYRPTYILIEARYRQDVEAVISPYYTAEEEFTVHDILYKRRDKKK